MSEHNMITIGTRHGLAKLRHEAAGDNPGWVLRYDRGSGVGQSHLDEALAADDPADPGTAITEALKFLAREGLLP